MVFPHLFDSLRKRHDPCQPGKQLVLRQILCQQQRFSDFTTGSCGRMTSTLFRNVGQSQSRVVNFQFTHSFTIP